MYMLLTIEWKDIALALSFLGGLALMIGALAFLVATWRARSDETWQKTAERWRGERDEARKQCEELKGTCKRTDEQLERFTQWYFREVAKTEWYRNTYGPIPPDVKL
jgi:hypothetical protein